MSSATFGSAGGTYRKDSRHTIQGNGIVSNWVVPLGCVLAYVALVAIERRYEFDHRVVDAFLHLSAAASGIALGHALVKQSMAKSTDQLRVLIDKYLNDLERKEENRTVGKKTEPLPLPIPYIVSRLRDKNDSGFGYFGAKLVNRDPRLLLDLSLDEALPPDEDNKIWLLTQQAKEASRESDNPAAASASAEKVSKDVVDALFTKLRPEVEAAVKEA